MGATKFLDLPVYKDRNRSFRHDDVLPRVKKWASSDGSGDKDKIDWKKYSEAWFWMSGETSQDPDNDGYPDNFKDYKLKFCDVIDGKLYAIPRGIFECAGAIDGARDGVDIPDSDRSAVKKNIEKYYEKMAKLFDDDSIEVPWKQKRSVRRIAIVGDLRAADPTVGEDGSTQSGKITGHAAVYGQTAVIGSWFKEVIRAGAFDAADLTDVPFLVNHDFDSIPLARSRRNNGNSTMTLTTDDIGLAFEANLDIDNNDKSKSLYSAIGRGDIDKMSYCFSVSEEEWTDLDTELPTREIIKIAKVYEISAVNFPAYDGTDIQLSSRDVQALESARALLESRQSALESEKQEIELLKLKCEILGGYQS